MNENDSETLLLLGVCDLSVGFCRGSRVECRGSRKLHRFFGGRGKNIPLRVL